VLITLAGVVKTLHLSRCCKFSIITTHPRVEFFRQSRRFRFESEFHIRAADGVHAAADGVLSGGQVQPIRQCKKTGCSDRCEPSGSLPHVNGSALEVVFVSTFVESCKKCTSLCGKGIEIPSASKRSLTIRVRSQ